MLKTQIHNLTVAFTNSGGSTIAHLSENKGNILPHIEFHTAPSYKCAKQKCENFLDAQGKKKKKDIN